MRMSSLLLLLLLVLTLPLSAANLRIVDFGPDKGSVTGGDVVTIIVDYDPVPVICDPFPCDAFPVVKFGDITARSATNSHGTITAVTPAHVKGNVPITVGLLGDTKTASRSFTFVDITEAQVPTYNYEQVLFPVAVSEPGGLPGAFGSLWKSEIWVTNRGKYPVEFFTGRPQCSASCENQGYPSIAPGETKRVSVEPGSGDAGYLFLAQKGGVNDLSYSLRVRDVSRSDDNHGTEVPVVRESELRVDGALLLNVPIDGRARTALRIYSNEPYIRDIPVRITAIPMEGADFVASKTITLTARPLTGGVNAYAQYAFLGDLRAEFPSLPEDTYRIYIANADPVYLHKLWALASVTNNRTQLVTAISP